MFDVKSILTINLVTSIERQDNLIHVHALQDANFMTSLELAVRFGKTLIIREMDGVEPALYPLLRRELIAQGSYSFNNSEVLFSFVFSRLSRSGSRGQPRQPSSWQLLTVPLGGTQAR